MIFCTCGSDGYCVACDAMWRDGKRLNPELDTARPTPSRSRPATEHTKSASKGESRRKRTGGVIVTRRKAGVRA